MNTTAILVLALVLLSPASGVGADAGSAGDSASDKFESPKIRIVFHQQEVIVEMFDNPASRDFLSVLPLTLEFSDYAEVEKITYLPRRLSTHSTPTPKNATGDFTYYAPWGNLAIFYKGFGRDGQLYVLGRIESGKEKLAAMSQTFTARIEKVK